MIFKNLSGTVKGQLCLLIAPFLARSSISSCFNSCSCWLLYNNLFRVVPDTYLAGYPAKSVFVTNYNPTGYGLYRYTDLAGYQASFFPRIYPIRPRISDILAA